MIELGQKVRSIVTGFEGIATARCEYLNGCVQICITPKIGDDGKHIDGVYVDIEQVEFVGEGVRPARRLAGGPQSNTPPSSYAG